ncbi:MAG: hypothetical protein QG657_5372 [Acidobacteriota bacterium]|nr:hypothetical protein [Acidobacteriota bacterium]
MLTEKFYDILDSEIDAIIDRYKDYPEIARHKNINQKKAYGFLIWFLEFYGHVSQFKNHITNGSDDASCDIIFDRLNPQGNKIFYVVQVKWFNSKNALGSISTTDVRKSLNDFETIIRGDKQKSQNKKFSESHRALLDHLDKNGKVKFIFLALAGENDDYKDNVASFNKSNGPNSTVEVIDIERIKRDYIDLKYKQIKKESPLEMRESPDYSKISLRIERFGDVAGKGDIIKTSRPYRSYIVRVKPAVIYELFRTFGFLLFYRNVRNPLPESNFNAQIARTLKDQPDLFWYFNNGITAVSRIIPEIGNEAREIEITGLQVINGAQTVYSIYRTYEDAGPTDRDIMDRDALIMLRLVDSSNQDVNREITRYTNSQNPMLDRDFHANDDEQVRVQNTSFDTVYWYEKRRGEFRQVPPGIYVIENLTLAAAYLAFYMEDVHGAVLKNDFIFISRDIDSRGLYEMIFTERVKFEDMLASYLVMEQILDFIHPNLIKKQEGIPISWDFHDVHFLLAMAIAPLFKLVFKEYLSLKLNEDADQINLTQYVLKNRPVRNVLENILIYVIHILKLYDSDGKINLKALEGKEAIPQLVDTVSRKKTNEKLELRLDIHRIGVESFEYQKSKEEAFEFMRPKEYYEQNTIQEDPRYVFTLMPSVFEKQYKKYIKEPIEKINLGYGKVYCKSNIEFELGTDQLDEVWKCIQKASVIIANITGFKPDLMLELGVALIKKSWVIIIAEKSLDGKTNLPFNIGKLRVEFYEPDKLDEFSLRLVNQVEKWINPDEPKIKNPSAILLMNDVLKLRREERYDIVLSLFESMDKDEPGNWYINKEWGITYKKIKDYENAYKKLQKALDYAKTNKHKSEIYTELGDVYRENSSLNDALVAFEKAENFDRDNAVLYERWAFLYYGMGKYHDAMNKMIMALKLDENNEVYKWKLEFYAKRFTDKNFGVELGNFLATKREEKTKMRKEEPRAYSRQRYSRGLGSEAYGKTLSPNASNRPENFERFVKHHKPKEVLEGEIIYVDPNLGVYVGLELNIVGLVFAKKLPKNFDVDDRFKVGRKIKVILLFFKYDKFQIDLGIAN